MTVVDANVRIPVPTRDKLAAIAAGEGLSLRAYLAKLADTLLSPEQRAERAAQTRAALKAWNGFDPTSAEEAELDDELDRRFAAAGLDPLPRP